MTPLESIYEVRSAIMELQHYMKSRDAVVSHRGQEQYEKWVNRFFRENINVVDSEKQSTCLRDIDYFLSILETTAENYYLNQDD